MNIFHKVTLKNLKKNRTRTLVTIIGCILSTAMVTAVGVSLMSFQDLIRQIAIKYEGNWHVCVETSSIQETQTILESSETRDAVWLQERGTAQLDEQRNCLNVVGLCDDFEKMVTLKMKDGRMPENTGEIILPFEMRKDYLLQSIFEAKVGRRELNGHPLRLKDYREQDEYLADLNTEQYQIVGYYDAQRSLTLGAYMIGFTKADPNEKQLPRNVYLALKHPKDYAQAFRDAPQICAVNSTLLHSEGVFSNTAQKAINGLACVLILLIMGASILLIYNAFSISVSERTQQFGLLSSVGATHRQMRSMVLFEALTIGGISIPMGIVSGILGISITFHFVGDKVVAAVADDIADSDITLRACTSPAVIGTAIVIALVTILISAWIPAKRATRVTAMEAIRQTKDISVTNKDVKVSRLVGHLFGMSGVLAKKYFRRSRKKYRTTVVSLSLSIVLFITAGALADYASFAVEAEVMRRPYDFEFVYYEHEDRIRSYDLLQKVCQLPHVDDAAYICACPYMEQAEDGRQPRLFYINYVSDNKWQQLLKQYHLDPEKYNDPNHPLAIAVDGKISKDPQTHKTIINDLIQGDTLEISIPQCPYQLRAGFVAEEMPFYVDAGSGEEACSVLIYPINTILQMNLVAPSPWFRIQAQNGQQARQQARAELENLLEEIGIDGPWVNDISAERAQRSGMITAVRVFSGGFIVLISMIAAANVFNTISTNIMLRRRDFAMLKTVGMSQREFSRMLRFECVLYGLKALLYGIPAAMLLVIWIDQAVGNEMEHMFRMPWNSIGIAVVSVFVVVAAAMAYAAAKIKNQNLIDALKEENL